MWGGPLGQGREARPKTSIDLFPGLQDLELKALPKRADLEFEVVLDPARPRHSDKELDYVSFPKTPVRTLAPQVVENVGVLAPHHFEVCLELTAPEGKPHGHFGRGLG